MDIFFLDKLIFTIIKGFFSSGVVLEGLPIGQFLKIAGTALVSSEFLCIAIKERVDKK